MAAGQRPINNVVDITNYVMLLTGQPMHAFDADLVAGGRLTVRRGRAGERMTHAGRRRAHARPGRLRDRGRRGRRPRSPASWAAPAPRSAPTTTRVLMEAATWNGPNIQRTSTRLGLRTEASGRFEKQLQPEQALDGQAVASALMLELCGAPPVGGTIDVGGRAGAREPPRGWSPARRAVPLTTRGHPARVRVERVPAPASGSRPGGEVLGERARLRRRAPAARTGGARGARARLAPRATSPARPT